MDPALIGEAGLWHRATGAETMERLLDSGVEIDAVFGLNDALALGALHALHARRIDVPGQIAVIGFDDIEETAYSSPTLTTVAPGREQIATTAVDLLLARIEELEPGKPFVQVITDFEIVGRESTLGEQAPARRALRRSARPRPIAPTAAPASGGGRSGRAGVERGQPLVDQPARRQQRQAEPDQGHQHGDVA